MWQWSEKKKRNQKEKKKKKWWTFSFFIFHFFFADLAVVDLLIAQFKLQSNHIIFTSFSNPLVISNFFHSIRIL